MDWSRKHLVDLAGTCKAFEADPTLSASQRQVFAGTYRLSKQLSSLPEGGGDNRVAEVIGRLCGACQDSSLSRECTGRIAWHQPCHLIQRQADRE